MSNKPIVYLVEDDQALRASLAWMLREKGFNVAEYGSPDELLAAIDPTIPGCLILDWNLPGMTGLELQRRLVKKGCRHPFIIISGQGSVSNAVKAMRGGAVDFLEKPFSHDLLVKRLSKALQIDWDSRRQQAELRAFSERLTSLTARERQVANLVVAGKLTKQIAKQLDISVKTVEVHRSRITKKLQVESVPQLVRLMTMLSGQEPESATD